MGELPSFDRDQDFSSTTHHRQSPSSQSPRPRNRELACLSKTAMLLIVDTMWRCIGALFPILRVQNLATTQTWQVLLEATCLLLYKEPHLLLDLDLFQLIRAAYLPFLSHLESPISPAPISILTDAILVRFGSASAVTPISVWIWSYKLVSALLRLDIYLFDLRALHAATLRISSSPSILEQPGHFC